MENKELGLPFELVEIANQVSSDKQNEVNAVLNKVFAGVEKMKKVIAEIVIEDEDDNFGMDLARQSRLAVRNERLDAEKNFDAKRELVQEEMRSFKTEDALWLKAKQIMQITTKDLEAQAKWKEDTKKRAELERIALLELARVKELSKYTEIEMPNIGTMEESTYQALLTGVKLQHEEAKAEEEKIETERLAKIEADRLQRIRIEEENKKLREEADKLAEIKRIQVARMNELRTYAAVATSKHEVTEDTTMQEFIDMLTELKGLKAKHDQNVLVENKRIEKIEKEKKALERYNALNKDWEQYRPYNTSFVITEETTNEEYIEAKNKAIERRSIIEAESDDAKTERWIDSFSLPIFDVQSDAVNEITKKFNNFKEWARKQV